MALKTPRPKNQNAKREQSHTLDARTYLDAEGTATTDIKKAVSLLGGAGKSIPHTQAVEVGLVKPAAKAKPAAKKSTPAANKKAKPQGNKAVKPAASKEA